MLLARILLLGVLMVLTQSPAVAGSGVRTIASSSATIFLAEIRAADPGEGCELFRKYHMSMGRCRTWVEARVLHVFKSHGRPEEFPTEFETEIQQSTPFSGFTPWMKIDLRVGEHYLIFSGATEDLPLMFATASGPVRVTDDEDMIADLELILRSENLTIAQQESAVAIAIRNHGRPHSYFLADYASALLRLGHSSETGDLAKAIETSSDDSFSNGAKLHLLVRLWDGLQSAPRPDDTVLHAYVVMTARYLLVEVGPASPELPDLRSDILERHIPWLAHSDQALALLRSALPLSLNQQFQNKAAELSRAKQVRPEDRVQLEKLLALMNSK